MASALAIVWTALASGCSSDDPTATDTLGNVIPPGHHDAGSNDDASGGNDAGPDVAARSISANAQDVFEAEDQIAVAPDGTIGVAWTAFGQFGSSLAYRFSTDDGASFTPIARVALPAGYYASDPAIFADAAGNFHLAILGVHFTGKQLDQTRVYVATAPRGSIAFGVAVEASDPSATRVYDHPQVFVTSKGTILVGFLQLDSLQSQTATGVAARSADGTAWTRSTIVGRPDVDFANLFWFCEGAGALYATFFANLASSAYIGMRASTDEGASWNSTGPAVSDAAETLAFEVPMCVASAQDVWVVYGTTPTPSASETSLDPSHAVRVAHSGDGGHTFDPARMEALDGSAGKLALLPLLVRESSGALDVAYFAGNSDGDASGSVRFVRSSGGAAFGGSTLIDGPLQFTLSRTNPSWLGDYFGAAAHAGALYTAYPLNPGGASHIFFAKTPLP